MSDLPAPGLHQGLSYADYDSWPAMRASWLKILAEKTPAHLRYAMDNPREDTETFALGRAVHSGILEPSLFGSEFVAVPDDAPSRPTERQRTAKKPSPETIEAIKWWDDFNDRTNGATVLKADAYAAAQKMIRAVWSHPTARELLSGDGMNEVSAFWIDVATGEPCRARIDRFTRYRGESAVVNIKTTVDAGPGGFRRQVENLNYHLSEGFHHSGLQVLSPYVRSAFFIAVEKGPPHCVSIYRLDREDLDRAMEIMGRHLWTYHECRASGHWPGYGEDINDLSLSRWQREKEGVYEG